MSWSFTKVALGREGTLPEQLILQGNFDGDFAVLACAQFLTRPHGHHLEHLVAQWKLLGRVKLVWVYWIGFDDVHRRRVCWANPHSR